MTLDDYQLEFEHRVEDKHYFDSLRWFLKGLQIKRKERKKKREEHAGN